MSFEPDIVILHAAETARCTARVDKRFDYFTLQLMTRGAVALDYDGEMHRLEGFNAWPAMPLAQRIRFGVADEGRSWHHRYAAFAGRLAERWWSSGLIPRGPQALERGVAERVSAALDEVIASVGQAGRWSAWRGVNALERALLVLAEDRVQTEASSRPAWLSELLERLADVTGPEVDLAAEAARLVIGESTLRRQLTAAAGLSPKQYRLNHKLIAARRLLVETDLPIKQIADHLGYCDVYHLTRHFSASVGRPPAAYRRQRL